MAARGGARVRALYSCEHWEIVKPSVSELSREVRTNILCTVKGCGKVLPNPPALNMHLVKSHGVQEGISNPTLRKDLKASQKLYCCPVEGCPRGTNRPFSQFSRVKQHFMKMHAEKKHKCEKCGSSYGTEWDLKRHIGYCGKTFKCTCGCPYTSRTALLSHTHRMGHEVPLEHRDPPVKKRKLDALKQNQKAVNSECAVKNDQPEAVMTFDQQMAELKASPASDTYIASYVTGDTPLQPSQAQKLLLPKPKLAVVKLPVMQLAHLPVLVPASDCPMKPVVVAVNSRGPVISTLQFVPHNGTVLPSLGAETSSSNLPQAGCLGAANSYVQVNMGRLSPNDSHSNSNGMLPKGKITSDVQTDLSYFTPSILPSTSWAANESSISSSSQTDLSFTAQMTLPISVETQTLQDYSSFAPKSHPEVSEVSPCLSCGISRETQTSSASLLRENPMLVDQAVSCDNIFNNTNSFYTVSTQTSQPDSTYIPGTLGQNLLSADAMKDIRVEEMKAPSFINFNTQNGTFPPQNMTDNQTQTMELLSDLEKILSDNISSQPLDNRNLLSAGEPHLSSNCNPQHRHRF
ncbi:unnamed protein product [Staurois parvus]|uniref:C2H2-type domain-containing protein n=1 Tax=Staurois parvus TaxID=386267 RepID=A0ABN9DR62_9NEOB|nr:unnamed protein product [Staurois parvus]